MGCGCGNKAKSLPSQVSRQSRGITQYYFLKDDSKLPPSASFIDPIDGAQYKAKPHESLQNFISSIQKSREEKGLPAIVASDLKDLVEVSLVEVASKKELKRFFELRATPVSASQIRSFAQNLIQELRSPGHVSYETRQSRADKCLSCKFHKAHGQTNETAKKVITRLLGLSQIEQSEKEKSLGLCGMCGCNLQAKTRLSLVSVIAGVLPEQLQKLLATYREKAFDTCWILNEGIRDDQAKKYLLPKLKRSGPRTEHLYDVYLSSKRMEAKNGSKR